MKISENTAVSMPMKNLISIIAAVAVGVWAYFGIVETLNKHSTTLELNIHGVNWGNLLEKQSFLCW